MELNKKSFSQFLAEDMNSVAGIATPPTGKLFLQSRKNLPQISNWKDFSDDLTKSGHTITQSTRTPESLYPTQTDFNADKVNALMLATESNNASVKPITISADDYIVDGHHRWMAALKGGKNVAVSQVQIPYAEIYDFLNDKAYVTKKELHESEQIVEGSTAPSEQELEESMKAWSKVHPGTFVHAWKVDGGYQYWADKGATHGTPHKHFISKADFAKKYTIQ